jgi:hypothetical protein
MFDGDPATDALRRAARNKAARWPSPSKDEEANRLVPEAWPTLNPRFTLKQTDTVFTIGSCFARNIERYLDQFGLDVPMMRFTLPPEEMIEARPQAIMNKYTPPSIFQELERTAELLEATEEERKARFMDVLLDVEGGYIDLELAGQTSVTLERGLQRREEVFQLFRNAFTADAVVITLGLIECWWDTERGKYVHPMPPAKELTRRKGRFQFKQLRFAEAYDYIRKTVDLIEAKGKPGVRILMTTSPVPLSATFTDQDVIIANLYSKSMLRTVAGEIYRNYETVDYFPSFENVMLTRTPAVWAEDLVHVTDAFVGKIVDNLLRHYLPDASSDQQAMARGVALLRMRDFAAAAEIFANLKPRTPRIDALHALARLDGGEAAALADLRKAGPKAELQGHECLLVYRRLGAGQAWKESAKVIENALAAGQVGQTERLDALLRLARMRGRLKDTAGVARALAEAEAIAPRRMSVLRSLAQHAMQTDNAENAVKYLTRIIKSPRFKTLPPEAAKRLRAAKILQNRKLEGTGKPMVDA